MREQRKLTQVQRRVLTAIDRYGYGVWQRQCFSSRYAIIQKLGQRGYVRHERIETPGADGHTHYVNWRLMLTDKGQKAVTP